MTSRQKKAQDRGKSYERWVAAQLGEKRILQKGTKVPDIIHQGWKLDCKHRKNFVAFSGFHACKEKYGHHTIVVMCPPGLPRERSIVIMSLADFQELLGGKDEDSNSG